MHGEIISHLNGFSCRLVDEDADRTYFDDKRMSSREACVSRILRTVGRPIEIWDRIDPTRP
jgi:hypothetical protein